MGEPLKSKEIISITSMLVHGKAEYKTIIVQTRLNFGVRF